MGGRVEGAGRGRWAAALALSGGLAFAGACGVGGDAPSDALGAAGGGPAGAETTSMVDDAASGKGAPTGAGDTGMTPALRAAYILARQRAAGPDYAIETEADAARLVAHNPAQGLHLSFAETGVAFAPDASDWSLRFDVAAWGCAGAMEPLEAAEPTLDPEQPNQVWQDHGPLAAWYLNGPLGLEQGFEVNERPGCVDRDELRVSVSVEGLTAAAGRDGVALRDDAGAVAMRVLGLYATDAQGRELEARLWVNPAGDVVIDVDVADATFPLTLDPLWVQQQAFFASDADQNDRFGRALDVSGDTAVIGAPLNDDAGNASGSAYVFVFSQGLWAEQQKLVASDAAATDVFGVSVAISGDTLVVGAEGKADDSGAAYIFTRSNNVWTEQLKLVPADVAVGDDFGGAVDIEGDTLAVASEGDDDNGTISGSVFVYARTNGVWSLQQKIIPDDPGGGGLFGSSVSLSGDTLAVGRPLDDDGGANSGAAYVFVRNAGMWGQQQKLTAFDASSGDRFGGAVALHLDTLVVGAFFDDDGGTNSGSAYVFGRSAGMWLLEQKLVASDAAVADNFGDSLSVWGDSIVVGAPNAGNAGGGAAYVFGRSGGTWVEQQVLQGLSFDVFGGSVVVEGVTALVGAESASVNPSTSSGGVYAYILTNNGDACALDTDCDSGFCVDGVCCDSACGGNDTSDCQACTAAQTGEADGTCAPVTGGTTCRAALGECDVAETCDGTATACPANDFVAAGASCGDITTTPCSSPDTCDGNGTCLDNDAAMGTACGDTANTECTAPDTCDANGACLGNHAPAGTPCGDQGVTCAVDDACNGNGFCTDNGFEPSTTVCRPASDVCDAAETCTGSSAGCPADGVAATGTVCRASTGSCDPEEQCDGTATACPADLLASAGDVGAPSCAPFLCDGTSSGCATTCAMDGDCAPMSFCDDGTCARQLLQGTACAADNQCATGFCADGVCCDSACGGTDATDCQACLAAATGGTDGVCAPISAGTTCRPGAGDCDAAEVCDGTATVCPADLPASDGTSCDDADACTENDACVAGTCAGDDICGEGGGGAGGEGGGGGTGGSGGAGGSGGTSGSSNGGASSTGGTTSTGGTSSTGGSGADATESDGGCTIAAGAPGRRDDDAPLRGIAAGLVGIALLRRRSAMRG